jgi:hypothetical protein
VGFYRVSPTRRPSKTPCELSEEGVVPPSRSPQPPANHWRGVHAGSSIEETRVARRAYIVHAIGAGSCLRLNPKPRRLLLHRHPIGASLPLVRQRVVERCDRRREGRWPTPGAWSTPSSSTPPSMRALEDNLRSALQASPASRQDVFWTASRRQMSRASRPAHSQCSAIGQNCRCRLVFEFSYIPYSIFHFLDML